MNRVLPGLYVGNFRDAKDSEQLEAYKITHIVSIHDFAKKLRDDIEYKCVLASDTPQQDLAQFFPECNDFIHAARVKGGNVLVHCLAGVSRSVTVTAAYMMTVTNYGWRDCLNAIRGARSYANPNFGFQRQLQNFDVEKLAAERARVKSMYESVPYNDNEEMKHLLDAFHKFVLHGDPNRDDGLLNLPHKAYKDRPKAIHVNSVSVETQGASKRVDNQNNQLTSSTENKLSNPQTVSRQTENNQSDDTQEPETVSPSPENNQSCNTQDPQTVSPQTENNKSSNFQEPDTVSQQTENIQNNLNQN